jgi:hypothetical protein
MQSLCLYHFFGLNSDSSYEKDLLLIYFFLHYKQYGYKIDLFICETYLNIELLISIRLYYSRQYLDRCITILYCQQFQISERLLLFY